LHVAIEDKNQYVRAWAAWALAEIGDRTSVAPLVQALEKNLKLAEHDMLMNESKSIPDLYLALESITGQKHGFDVEKWKEYLKKVDRKKTQWPE
jgi:HEAT repeat protein